MVSAAPDYSLRKRSAKQKAASGRFCQLARQAHRVLANLKPKAAYEREARRKNQTSWGVIMADRLKAQRAGGSPLCAASFYAADYHENQIAELDAHNFTLLVSAQN